MHLMFEKGLKTDELRVMCGYKNTKGREGRQTDRKEGGFRNELGREFGVPVTWLECRAAHSDGCVIRSETDTEDFLSAASTAAHILLDMQS